MQGSTNLQKKILLWLPYVRTNPDSLAQMDAVEYTLSVVRHHPMRFMYLHILTANRA